MDSDELDQLGPRPNPNVDGWVTLRDWLRRRDELRGRRRPISSDQPIPNRNPATPEDDLRLETR